MKKTKSVFLRYAALLIAAALFIPLAASCDELDYILSDLSQQVLSLSETTDTERSLPDDADSSESEQAIAEDGVYDQKDDVALYLHTYGRLPSNYITKKQAQGLGWEGGPVEKYAPGCCIGGDYFGNYENKLPKKKGRSYYECDIGTLGGKSRGAKRIIYSNDGLIYYTEDHYETFTLLYGEE